MSEGAEIEVFDEALKGELISAPVAPALSPYATPLAPRLSPAVLGAADPAAAAAAEFLLSIKSPSTREAYKVDLGQWYEICRHLGVSPLEARRDHADRFRLYLVEGRCLAPATVARKLSAVSSFYRYLVVNRVLSETPFLGVARPHVSEESTTLGLTKDELVAFLAAAAADGLRSGALIALLAINGLRISEALSRDVEHLTYDRGHRVLLLERKGGKRAKAPLSPPVVRALETHIGKRTTGPIFITASSRRLDRRDAWRIVRRLAREANIAAADRISPHSARHAFGTGALDAGASLRDVQDAMGHADPRTTRRYDRARHNNDRHPTYRLAAWLAED